ncbi:T9SS type A sorting domain-containing protein [Flavobacterium facile]|uniref:T9SS type A sorting domain-containing protein n=1 Tax=Flavobacterium facile TaxID=2893174 RepID=UPI002E784FDC|nr:T9SS type A sorting domain-containing protein [Flavobacterium sp. T-12]
MKKIIYLLLLFSAFANAQIVNIPDANFKTKLLEASPSNEIASTDVPNSNGEVTSYHTIDTNSDGEIQISEALAIKYLNLQLATISSIDGISSFQNLITFNCRNNMISVIDLSSFQNLKFFNCLSNAVNQLTLPSNNTLLSLEIGYNPLTSLNLNGNVNIFRLNILYTSIPSLDIGSLTNLNEIQYKAGVTDLLNFNNKSNITYLGLSNSTVTSFNFSEFPNLVNLDCHQTNLVSIDLSQNPFLTSLYASYNSSLQLLNLKNGGPNLTGYQIVSNTFDYVCVNDDVGFSFLNYLSDWNGGSSVVNAYCSFTPGGSFNTISGSIIYDENGGGCEATDLPQPNIKIDITNGVNQGSTFTDNSGNYKFYTDAGNFTMTPNMENPTLFTVTPATAIIPFANDNNNTVTQNFCISPNGIHPDLEIVVAPIVPARPGFDAIYKIVYKNKGNQTLSQAYGVNFFYNENLMDFVSASVVPTSINSGGLSWSYANLLPFESRSVLVIFSINTPTDITNPVIIGDVLQFTTSILPMAGDENTSDNTFLYNQTVVGAYDPNNIICMEGNVVSPSLIGEYLHYAINFENTGNYEAENIVVKTEINPAQFDVNSLRMLNTSHNAYVRINNNIVEFVFENITLESGGHGNILLKVKSKGNLTNGAIVKKRADIFFDYNAPIDTGFENTVFQALSNSSFIKDNSVSIYPNPTNSIINIKCDNTIKSLELFDVQGRILITKMVNDHSDVLDISNKANGIYFLKITSENGIKVEKLIKE